MLKKGRGDERIISYNLGELSVKDKKKISVKEKENKLIEKIEKAKNDLAKLQSKRQLEIGKIAIKHGLDSIDNKILNNHFAKMAEELVDGN